MLNEDTVKLKNGKWANVGKDGKVDSGTFKTKKQADAQRRAMFSHESLKECALKDGIVRGVFKVEAPEGEGEIAVRWDPKTDVLAAEAEGPEAEKLIRERPDALRSAMKDWAKARYAECVYDCMSHESWNGKVLPRLCKDTGLDSEDIDGALAVECMRHWSLDDLDEACEEKDGLELLREACE